MKVFIFGAYTYRKYGGKLIEVKIIAEDKKTANEIIKDIITNSKYIDADEWFF